MPHRSLAITSAQRPRNSSSGNSNSEGREREKLADGGSVTRRLSCRPYETSPPHVAGDQALGFQQRIGGRNRGPVQSKLTSQFASGWQSAALGQRARFNQPLHLRVKLTEKRRLIVRIQWTDLQACQYNQRISHWLARGNPPSASQSRATARALAPGAHEFWLLWPWPGRSRRCRRRDSRRRWTASSIL